MTATIIALSIAVIGCSIVALASVRWGMAKSDAALKAGRALNEAQRTADEQIAQLARERDELKVRHDLANEALAATRTRLKIVEQQRNTARLEERAHVVQRIRESGNAAAAAVVNDLLQSGPKVP